MKVATSWSTEPDARVAVESAYKELLADLGQAPNQLFLHCSSTYDCEALLERIHTVAPGVPLHGSTSCLGAMTEEGFHSAQGVGLALMGLADEDGSYGVGAARIGDDAHAAAASAMQQALEQAEMPGVLPAMVWVCAAPGNEEQVLLGIESVLGAKVPIAGGSAADNEVAGQWKQFANDALYEDAVVVTALLPSVEVKFAFHSGYEPTTKQGRVTRADGRELCEIDGRPAVEVYDEWTEGALSEVLQGGGNVLAHTTLHPLGRVAGEVGGVPYFRLSHPDGVLEDGSITLFTEIAQGEELTLMQGTHESLIQRAGRVARSAVEMPLSEAQGIAGALVIYCAGCMLTVQDRMQEVVGELNQALGNKPFLGSFTFGEQGCFLNGENHHGNLMISVLVFGQS